MSEPPTEELPRIPPGFVMHNGELVSREEMAVAPTSSPDRSRWWKAGGALLAVLVLGLVVAGIVSRSGEDLPTQQERFVAAVVHGQDRVRDGNDVTVVDARLERDRTICDGLPRRGKVSDWVGRIKEIDTPLVGDAGMVTVALGHDIELKTSSSLLAPAGESTGLQPGSEVFTAVANLHDGDTVRFGGYFVPAGGSCIKETSIRDRNGMLTPGFVFRFTSIAPG